MQTQTEQTSLHDIQFSCGCREWRISEKMGDTKGITEQPPDTVIDHQCAKIVVYRINKGLSRHFRKV